MYWSDGVESGDYKVPCEELRVEKLGEQELYLAGKKDHDPWGELMI